MQISRTIEADPPEELSGAPGLNLHELFFERLTHFVRSKMSIPAAVIKDQLAGAQPDRQDLADSADAIDSVLRMLAALESGQGYGAVETSGISGKIFVDETGISKSVCALVRYLHSFSILPIESFCKYCTLQLIFTPDGERLILAADLPAAVQHRTRISYFSGRSLTLEELIGADHGVPSLLLFTPIGELSKQGLRCNFAVMIEGRLTFSFKRRQPDLNTCSI